MIEETGTSGCDQIPAMKASISHSGVHRSRDTDVMEVTDVTISGTGKRMRFCSGDEENVIQLDVDVHFDENVASTAVSGGSDHVNSAVVCSINDDAISDLKVECVSETDNFIFSTETSTSSVICLESEEMEPFITKKKKLPPATAMATETTTATEATSRRKQPPTVTTLPFAAEIEEFFSKAEKYEQKRFAEKYNFDIVKDVPMEGRYQWLPLKP